MFYESQTLSWEKCGCGSTPKFDHPIYENMLTMPCMRPLNWLNLHDRNPSLESNDEETRETLFTDMKLKKIKKIKIMAQPFINKTSIQN